MATETDNHHALDLSIDLTDADFCRLAEIVQRHCGINLHDGKRELVRARLAKQMRAGGYRSARAYLEDATHDPASRPFTQLIDALSTNLTGFFREKDHFEYLAQRFLPGLIERRRRQPSRRLRAWSCASSTGEEPYSIAMTLLDALPPGEAWDVKLLATDLSTRVLRIAEAGTYEASRVEAIPPSARVKYLAMQRIDGQSIFAMQPAVREIVRFRHLNLMEPFPFGGPLDFIFCRNVMIYFDKPTQERLVNRLYELLEPGGLLFTGHSESLTGIHHPLQYVQPTIYMRK
jgi:chemotaxis protein methyltransferase CheR